jgi:hypothetical protein
MDIYRAEIFQLYTIQGKRLDDVMKKLKDDYGFESS